MGIGHLDKSVANNFFFLVVSPYEINIFINIIVVVIRDSPLVEEQLQPSSKTWQQLHKRTCEPGSHS